MNSINSRNSDKIHHYPNELAIVFDFGGVLIDWNIRYLYRQYLPNDEAIGRFLHQIHFREYNDQMDRGRPFKEVCAEMYNLFPQHRELLEVFDTRWIETIGGPIWPTVDILRILKDAGKRLFGLSNWNEEKFAIVRAKYDFFNWFEAIVISGEAKTAKPDEEIFRYFLNKIGWEANQCLFIDDSAPNIATAKKLGFQTIQFRSALELEKELKNRGIMTAGDKPL